MNRFARVSSLTLISLLIFANSIFGQPDSIYRLPVGTQIRLKLDAEINSRVSSVDDTFIAIVTQPVKIRETVVIPADTVIEGRVTKVSRAASGGRRGNLEVRFETLKISNHTLRIEGEMVTEINAESNRTLKLVSILGGLIAGTAIGAASGSSRGALIGASVGGGTGAAVALLSKGKDVRIKKDREFEIELRKEVLLPVLDY